MLDFMEKEAPAPAMVFGCTFLLLKSCVYCGHKRSEDKSETASHKLISFKNFASAATSSPTTSGFTAVSPAAGAGASV